MAKPDKRTAKSDPFEGDHYASDWKVVTSMVKTYATLVAIPL